MSTNTTPHAKEHLFAVLKKIDAGLFLLGTVLIALRFAHIHYATQLYIVVLLSIAGIPFLVAVDKDVAPDIRNPLLHKFASISLSVLIVGVLFSSLFWPGGRVQTMVGTLASFVAMAWMAIAIHKKEVDLRIFYPKLLLAKLSFFALLGLWFLITPAADQYKLLSKHGKDPIAVRLYTQHMQDPRNKEKAEAFSNYIKEKDRHK